MSRINQDENKSYILRVLMEQITHKQRGNLMRSYGHPQDMSDGAINSAIRSCEEAIQSNNKKKLSNVR